MAVCTESLQVVRVVVPSVTVDVVHVELTNMLWLKPAVFTNVLLVDSVRIDTLVVVAFVDGLTTVPTVEGFVLVSKFNSGRSTDRARGRAIVFIVVRKTVVHRLGKAPSLDFHRTHRFRLGNTKRVHYLQS